MGFVVVPLHICLHILHPRARILGGISLFLPTRKKKKKKRSRKDEGLSTNASLRNNPSSSTMNFAPDNFFFFHCLSSSLPLPLKEKKKKRCHCVHLQEGMLTLTLHSLQSQRLLWGRSQNTLASLSALRDEKKR